MAAVCFAISFFRRAMSACKRQSKLSDEVPTRVLWDIVTLISFNLASLLFLKSAISFSSRFTSA
jgi:hypothetical protein